MKSEHGTRPPTKGEPWQWREGLVNTNQDHFELHYGKAFGDLIPVATVEGVIRRSKPRIWSRRSRSCPVRCKVEMVIQQSNRKLQGCRCYQG